MHTPSDPPPAVRVLYVGGLPRSGSTLIDLLLHHLPGHIGVGELFYLWRTCVVHDGLCSCGKRFSECAFWQAVGQQAYGGWHRVDADEVLRLQDVVDKTSVIPLLLARRRPGAFQRALDDYTSLLERLYQAIAAVSGDHIVVDSSKRPSMAFILRAMPAVDLRIAPAVRDPRGVALSFGKHVALGPGVALREEMPRSTARKVARRWLTVNATIASLVRLGVPLCGSVTRTSSPRLTSSCVASWTWSRSRLTRMAFTSSKARGSRFRQRMRWAQVGSACRPGWSR